jgi:hypothetical protein
MGWGAILVPGDYEAEGRNLVEDVLKSLRENQLEVPAELQEE